MKLLSPALAGRFLTFGPPGKSAIVGFFFLNNFVLFLPLLGLRCSTGFSLVGARGGYSLVVVHGLLIAVAFLVAERRVQSTWASVVVARGFSCSLVCDIFPDQESNPCLLHWQADSLPLNHQGSPVILVLICISLSNDGEHFFLFVGLLYVFFFYCMCSFENWYSSQYPIIKIWFFVVVEFL